MRQHYKAGNWVPLLQIGTSSHRCGHCPCRVKQLAKEHDLVQSGKSSLTSWPDVKLILQTNKPQAFHLLFLLGFSPFFSLIPSMIRLWFLCLASSCSMCDSSFLMVFTWLLLCLCVTPQLVKLQIENRSHVCYVMGGCSSAFIHKSKSCRLRPDR